MKYLLFFILLLNWLLGGCRSVESSPATPTPDAAPTLRRTQTAEPEKTETVASIPSKTTVPAEITLAPSATPTIIATIVALSQPRIHSSHLSPDRKWRADVVIYDCVPVGQVDEFAYEQLNLIQVASDTTEIADRQLQSCGGLGAFGLDGLFWSPNSRYFYYTTGREGVPDGCGFWEPPIFRLDVTNVETEDLGSGIPSKDEAKLATWQGQELVVWDVNEGEIARLPAFASDAEAGPITWSPDSQGLVYIQFDSYCPLSGRSYVVHLDLTERRQSLLIESETPSFGSAAWENVNMLILRDGNGNTWNYNFATKELKRL